MPPAAPVTAPLRSQAELMAPAGDWDALRAAVANGADAVYLGLPHFNARHRAANFTLESLPQVMAFLHGHNVHGYVTFNTLVFSDEFDQAVPYLKAIAAAGTDALIVQDLGLALLATRLAPNLPLHASTQMTLTDPHGITWLRRRLGITRAILARELSLTDIRQVAAHSPVPVEVFVHGALCVAYSGQCLTSEALGGRSANRGQCAQACRLPYELLVDGRARPLDDCAYLLSPRDLAAYDLLDPLLKAGVASFKIEGRLKSAHYVAAATGVYRAALDAALAGRPFRPSPQGEQDLAQSFSRGFSHGFLDGVNHQTLVHGRFPKNRGLRLGRVEARGRRGLVVHLDPPGQARVKPGDGVVFDQGYPEQDEQGGRVFAVHPLDHAGRRVELTFARGSVNLAAVEPGSLVWKTDDPAVRRRLEQTFARAGVPRRQRMDLFASLTADQRLRVEARDAAGRCSSATTLQPLSAAQRHPLTLTLLREQFGRLGDTPYELCDVTLADAHGRATVQLDVMAPRSVLNDLRRAVVAGLLAQRHAPVALDDADALEHLRRWADHHRAVAVADHPPRLTVLVRTLAQLQAVLAWAPTSLGIHPAMVYLDFEDVRRYPQAVALARDAGIPVALASLRISKPGEEGLVRQLLAAGPDAILVRNLAVLAMLDELVPDLPRVGDYALNVTNELTAALLLDAGLYQLTPGYDLNWRQMSAMLARIDPGFFEVVIHQHMPMFHMEHCVFAHLLSNGADHRTCGRPCERHQVSLRDRAGAEHALAADAGCRNTLFNAAAQSAAQFIPRMLESGLRLFRVELLREEPRQAADLLDRYARILAGREAPATAWRSLRVLSQLGVTAGTLETT